MSGDATRHARIAALFDAVRDLDRAEAEARLRRDEADAALIDEVLALLDAARDEAFLAPDQAAAALEALVGERALESGRRLAAAIGGLEIRRILGQGAMGIVYLAEQHRPQRLVALKAMRPGATNARLVARFEREAELLARLRHEGIAQVHAAGSIDAGDGPQPYFVMEYVEGTDLLAHAETGALPWRARVELLALVADAVEHAHAQGVVHRDLKPDNILVDAQGRPKVLDFGIARATDAERALTTRHTILGQLLGTVPYMSPEQAAGELERIDARSDVYALGVIGFELLTGRLPYAVLGVPVHEAVRRIRDEEPTHLSGYDRVFRGDLDTVFATALAKEPERRYASAGAFGADLRRVLTEEPITARRPRTIEQVARFARRNRGLVAGIAIAFVGMTAATVLSVGWALEADAQRADATDAGERARLAQERSRAAQREAEAAWGRMAEAVRDAERARQNAEAEQRNAADILEFVTADILNQASPDTAGGRLVPMVDILVAAAAKVDETFADRPHVAARVHLVLARTFAALAMHLDAAREAAAAERLYRAAADDAAAEESARLRMQAAEALTVAANAERSAFRLEEAEADFRRAIELQLEARPETHSSITHARLKLGETLSLLGRWAEAEAEIRAVLEMRERKYPNRRDLIASARTSLAEVLVSSGRPHEALPLLEQAETALARLEPHHSLRLWRDQVEAAAHWTLGDDARAESIFADLVTRAAASHGADSVRTHGLRSEHAAALLRAGRTAEALATLDAAHGAFAREFGPTHGVALLARDRRAEALLVAGDRAAALAEAQAVHADWLATCGPASPFTIEASLRLAEVLLAHDRLDELERASAERARSLAAEAAETARPFGETHPLTLRAERVLALAEVHAGDAAAGLTRLVAAHARSERAWGAAHPETLLGHAAIADAHLHRGELDAAVRHADEGLALLSGRAVPWPDLESRLRVLCARAHALRAEPEAAAHDAAAALAIVERTWGERHPRAAAARDLLTSVAAP